AFVRIEGPDIVIPLSSFLGVGPAIDDHPSQLGVPDAGVGIDEALAWDRFAPFVFGQVVDPRLRADKELLIEAAVKDQQVPLGIDSGGALPELRCGTLLLGPLVRLDVVNPQIADGWAVFGKAAQPTDQDQLVARRIVLKRGAEPAFRRRT